jgi:uncharacterized protein YbjT (DUF2867 family)
MTVPEPEAISPEPDTTPLQALIAGATGLVGRALLEQLLEAPEYARVTALSRREIAAPEKLTVELVDFDRPERWRKAVSGQHVFCCLGTTIKKAGSQAAFRKVDYELPLELARAARANGAFGFFVVTALGADEGSSIFYNRVKGELEARLKELDYPTLAIFRPSLLLGEREEARFGERVAAWASRPLSPLLGGSLRKYRPIAGRDVAAAMLSVARTAATLHAPLGFAIYESDAIAELARGS